MVIQPLVNLTSAYSVSQRLALQSGSNVISQPAISSNSDTVTISQIGKNLAAISTSSGSDAITTINKSSSYAWRSVTAHSLSSSDADAFIQQSLSGSDDILVTEESTEHPPLRLATTNAVLTDSDIAWFNQTKTQVSQTRINIYEAEKAKGTPPAEIMDKILAYMDSLPAKYGQMSSAWNQAPMSTT